ncbi:MAG: chromosome segregation protein SMC [Oscillospiraceae bacterium]|nr:chromosome segregation protein SMC [Oscillospiraceae bacterium]
MYLKSLEIQGFKSFPDKTILQFGGEITAIVGPNGSGKSNISDAIRWVMGEQSTKALRGAKMEDVIFGGTVKRGSMNFAEVSLVLDNTSGTFSVEADEVMVTRRYYRSGDSEYYINRQSARLRDVNELFMDTGLGKEGYSNIGQGRIDEILSVKSQDRREIFEEAAGISKFRHRKEETERRLASAEENLLRIGDKISELELQVEPLRVQAENAKKYLVFRDELRGLEVTLWLNKLDKLADSTKAAEQSYAAASALLADANQTLQAMYADSERLTAELRNQDVRAEQIRDQIASLEQNVHQQDATTAVLRGRLDNHAQNIARIRQELSDAENHSGTLAAQIAAAESRIASSKSALTQLSEQLRGALERGRSLSDCSDQTSGKLLELRSNQAAILTAAADKKVALSAVTASVQAAAEQATLARTDLSAAKQRHASARAQADACARQLQAARDAAAEAGNMIAGYALRMKARAEKRDALKQQVSNLYVERDTTASRIKMFREMEREYEGFSRAVRIVMQEAERGGLRNIHAPVSRLLKTKQEYALAIETALGSSMQSIVVSAESDGKAAINLLHRRDGGRATFLPLTAIRGRTLDERGVESCAGFVGIGSALVEYDAQYRNIFENLLGRTVIAENLDDAVTIARQFGYRFRIVTLDGHVMNAGGSMTGGSSSKSAGILSRAGELARLVGVEQQLGEKIASAEASLNEASRLASETQYEITEAEGRLREHQDEVLRLEGQNGQFAVLLQTIESAMQDYQGAMDTAERRDLESAERIAALRSEIDTLERQSADAEQEAAALLANQQSISVENGDITEQINKIRMESAAMDAEQRAAADSLAQLCTLRDGLSGDRAVKEQTIAEFEQGSEALHTEIAESEQRAAEIASRATAARDALKACVDARTDVEGQRIQTEKRAQEKNADIINLERECARLEQQKNAAELEEKQILDKLWDSYELTYDTAQSAKQTIENLSEISSRIAELRRKIAKLGSPNIGAIEEFERVNERYLYLTGQRDDITKSKKDLAEIVNGITGEMTTIFRTQFTRIDEGFGKTFVEMFGGGRGQLVLEDETDILNCGIEIRVQPPGKQLKTLTLLSGGEKALVAIALYFAILKVRPTPFCMLDEIDAALDDRNVARYSAYLRGLSGNTQFIVITHRRGTMEEADVLYGVTMQEEGVSKMLSINLNEMSRRLGIR